MRAAAAHPLWVTVEHYVVLARETPSPGELGVVSPSPATAVGITAGDDVAQSTKFSPNEVSAGLVTFDEVTVAVVADAHYGPEPSERLVPCLTNAPTSWSADNPADKAALPALTERCVAPLEAHWTDVAPISPTLLKAATSDTVVRWMSVGDPSLFLIANEDMRRLNRYRPDFLERPRRHSQSPYDDGEIALRGGQGVLLATDGIEEQCSGLAPADIACELSGGRASTAPLARLFDRAGLTHHRGGGDNLAAVSVTL